MISTFQPTVFSERYLLRWWGVIQYCSVKENCLLRQAGGAGDAGAAEGENGTSSSASSAPSASSASLNWSVSSLTEQYWGVIF
ncbi:MAG: hypothetical protein QNJ33_14110 [Crocosphaera sp.]|nr:hypothetical protein [Crocosphaera sp.]